MTKPSEGDADEKNVRQLDEGSGKTSFKVTKADIQILEQSAAVSFDISEDNTAFVRAGQKAGVVGLPDGPDLYLEPKISGTNLLYLLQYSQGIEATVDDETASLESSGDIAKLVALMYIEELRKVLRRGLSKSYETVQESEEYIRGDLDLHRQLQTHGPAATEFECRYRDLSEDTLLNQTVLYAGWILLQAVGEENLRRRLRSSLMQLRRPVTLRKIRRSELSQLNLSRLDRYYQQVLRISETVIQNGFVNNLNNGDSPAYAFTIPTPVRFQQAVHTCVERYTQSEASLTIKDPEYSFEAFPTGDFDMELNVDTVVCKDGSPVLAIDAKYTELSDHKTDRKPDSKYVHQIATYTDYLDCPGLFVYPEPEDGEPVERAATLYSGHEIVMASIPTNSKLNTYKQYREQMDESLNSIIEDLVDTVG